VHVHVYIKYTVGRQQRVVEGDTHTHSYGLIQTYMYTGSYTHMHTHRHTHLEACMIHKTSRYDTSLLVPTFKDYQL
jgi:hypothetical protein